MANGLRYTPSGHWWAGRDNATLTEPTSSHRNCLKTRTLRSSSPTSVAVAPWRHRVHVVDPALRGCVGRFRFAQALLTQTRYHRWHYKILHSTFFLARTKTQLANAQEEQTL